MSYNIDLSELEEETISQVLELKQVNERDFKTMKKARPLNQTKQSQISPINKEMSVEVGNPACRCQQQTKFIKWTFLFFYGGKSVLSWLKMW